MRNLESKIKDLENKILHHKAAYYSGNPEIHDHEYDYLEEELKKLDPDNRVLGLVGTNVLDGEKVKHDKKMLSLDKCYKQNDLIKWIGKHAVVTTYKIDGVSCSIIYEQGKLVLAKTRGDGVYGEKITNKVDWMKSIPKHILVEGRVEIRGEIFCNESNFIHLSEEMVRLGLSRPTSMRNIVAGLIGRKEHLHLCRFLSFNAFDFISDDEHFKTEWEKKKFLEKCSFEIPPSELLTESDEIVRVIRETEEFMGEGDYQIDGLVLSYNDLKLHEELGETSHHPRYKIAFKFQGDSKQTEIKEVVWSVSRNGVLTPVANVKSVELSGAKISRVTLHNYGMVKEFQLKKGDVIEIIRSGEVIPKFISVIKSSERKFEIIENCPVCKTKVQKEDIRLYCPNIECPGRNKEAILYFIKKIGIDDLSSKRLDDMLKNGLIKSIPDLYKLSVDDFLSLDKTKEKLANKLYASIQRSKKVDLATFVTALGLAGVAKNKNEKIIQFGHDTIEKFKRLDVDKLIQVDSFAEKSANEYISSLKSKLSLIDELLKLGFMIEKPQKIKQSYFTGKKICITGALSIKRSEMEDKLRRAGAIIVNSVSKNTDFLLTNEQDGQSSKFIKAKKLNIPIINEEKVLSEVP